MDLKKGYLDSRGYIFVEKNNVSLNQIVFLFFI